jgi:hypothetical protein
MLHQSLTTTSKIYARYDVRNLREVFDRCAGPLPEPKALRTLSDHRERPGMHKVGRSSHARGWPRLQWLCLPPLSLRGTPCASLNPTRASG